MNTTIKILTTLLLAATHGFAQESADSTQPPPYAFLRNMEDWSGFRAANPARDRFDPIKHIDLTADGDVWVSFGGRVESRFERWGHFGFDSGNHDDFVVSRVLVHGDLHAGEHFRFFVEGKSAQATDRDLPGGRRTLDMDTLAVQQAFAEIQVPVGEATWTLRPGRQMLLFGAQRMISPLPWGNTLRTWQGMTVEWRQADWSVTGIATEFVPVDKTRPNDPDDDVTLYGIHARRSPGDRGHGLELYALGTERPMVTFHGTSGASKRQTFGVRTWGPMRSSSDYEVEATWQVGEVGANDVQAWSLATQAGWRPGGLAGKPRFWIGLDAASGDSAPGGDVETFDQLFPLGHAYFGHLDAIGRQNILAVNVGGKWATSKSTSLAVAGHVFRSMEAGDSIYNAGGAATFSGSTSRDVGMEIDARIDHRFDRHLKGYVGYGHFFPGQALKQVGPGKGMDFAYVGLSFTF